MNVRGREHPEVNARGELSFAEQTRMTHGLVPGAERLSAVPADDSWYDQPAGPPVLPDVDDSAWGRHHRISAAG